MEKYVAYAAETHEYDFFPTFEAAAQWLLGDDWSEGYSRELIDGESYIAEITHVTAVKVTDKKENYPLPNGEEWPYGKRVDWIGEPYMKKVEDDE